MEARNSSGRKISLLNDGGDVAPETAKALPSHHKPHHHSSSHHHQPQLLHHHQQLHHHHRADKQGVLQHQRHQSSQYQQQLPPLAAVARSRSPSRAPTPSLSPQTPQLVRSDSSDSRFLTTPSPVTPSYDYFVANGQAYANPHRLPHGKVVQHYYFAQSSQQQPSSHQQQLQHRWSKMDEHHGSMYPPIPDATGVVSSAYPMPAQMTSQMSSQPAQQLYRSSVSPASEPSRVSTMSAASNPPKMAAPKKNQYPCPMAKQVGCNDYFTTSGHAARHAKKHTGKKDAFCPECNKAFTRKDNMEQHRRTHQNGRGVSRTSTTTTAASSTVDDGKVKKTTKPTIKKPTIKDQSGLEAAVEQQIAEQRAQAQIPLPTPLPTMRMPTQQMQPTDPAMMIPHTSGPYYIGSSLDSGPIPPLPMPSMAELGGRPSLHRSNYTNSVDYMPPAAQMLADPDMLNYSYPSPGLSNGLNSLALAASEHRRLSEKTSKSPSSDTPSHGSP